MQLGCENKKKKNIKNRNCCAVLLRQKSEVHVWGKTASECWTANIRNTSTCANSLSAPKFNFPELNEKPDFLAAERHVTLTKLTLSSSGANRKIQERVEEEFREEGKCKIQDLCENAVSYKTGSCRVQGRRGKEWDASRLEQETGGKETSWFDMEFSELKCLPAFCLLKAAVGGDEKSWFSTQQFCSHNIQMWLYSFWTWNNWHQKNKYFCILKFRRFNYWTW